ncbi:MAG TPA: hypothetical protein VIG44_13120 [Thermomicrobiales bacterium]|jgi:hypothetical protein
MESNLCREALAARLFDERAARALGQAWVAEVMENAGAHATSGRSRKRRERVARFLKALAFRLAPPAMDTGRTRNSAATIP